MNPDEFYVFKPTLAAGKRPILKRQLGSKAIKMIYAQDAGNGVSTRNVTVPDAERVRFALTDDDTLELARYALKIEQHYSKQSGRVGLWVTSYQHVEKRRSGRLWAPAINRSPNEETGA